MYGAVIDRRDFINNALDEGFDNEDDHFDALATLRISNSIIRKLKAAFKLANIDIDAFIGNDNDD